jgi:hypothetical protein
MHEMNSLTEFATLVVKQAALKECKREALYFPQFLREV